MPDVETALTLVIERPVMSGTWDGQWPRKMLELLNLTEELRAANPRSLCTDLRNRHRHGDEILDELEKLLERYSEITERQLQLVGEIYARLVDEPTKRLLAGELLSKTEFYLARAGCLPISTSNFPELVKAIGRDWYDEYDVYRLLYYQDDNIQGLIYPRVYFESMKSPRGRRLMITPVKPDQVQKASLSEEQRVFFETHFPEEYSQFR